MSRNTARKRVRQSSVASDSSSVSSSYYHENKKKKRQIDDLLTSNVRITPRNSTPATSIVSNEGFDWQEVQLWSDADLRAELRDIELNNTYNSLSVERIESIIKRLHEYWLPPDDILSNPSTFQAWMLERMELQSPHIDLSFDNTIFKQIEISKTKNIKTIVDLRSFMSNTSGETKNQIIFCLKMINQCSQNLNNYFTSINFAKNGFNSDDPDFDFKYYSYDFDSSENKDARFSVINFLLLKAKLHNYKRCQNFCYKEVLTEEYFETKTVEQWREIDTSIIRNEKIKEQIIRIQENHQLMPQEEVKVLITKAGLRTRSYVKVCEIKEFIFNQIQFYENANQFKNLITGSNCDAAIKFITGVVDPRFQDITKLKSKNLLAFRNGIYNSEDGSFYYYDDSSILQNDKIPCKYFDLPFDDHIARIEDWRLIETPHFDSVLNYQEFSPEVYRWICVFLGRLLHDIGKDNWQVMFNIYGSAGTGKSLIAKIVSSFFDESDVGTVSASGEAVFGLSEFYNKYIGICTETEKKFVVFPESKLKAAICGEPVSISIKNKTPQSEKWKTGLFFIGNDAPVFSDSHGSMKRRNVVVYFEKTVGHKDKNTQLETLIQEEMPLLIRKFNEAYHEALAECGNRDIWDCLPEYFNEMSKKLQAESNALCAFIYNECTLGRDKYIEFSQFENKFNLYISKKNYRKVQFDTRYYKTPFEENGISVVNNIQDGSGRTVKGKWIVGVTVNTD